MPALRPLAAPAALPGPPRAGGLCKAGAAPACRDAGHTFFWPGWKGAAEPAHPAAVAPDTAGPFLQLRRAAAFGGGPECRAVSGRWVVNHVGQGANAGV